MTQLILINAFVFGPGREGKRDCPLSKKGQPLFPSSLFLPYTILTGLAGALDLVDVSTTFYNDNS